MDRKHVTRLALRLFGLYAAISAVSMIGPVLRELTQLADPGGRGWDGLYATSSFVAWGVAAVVLLRFGSRIADRWCSDEPATAPAVSTALRARDLELVGYRLLGVLAIVSNLSSCVELLIGLMRPGGVSYWPQVPWGIGNILTVALGLWLLLGARGIAEMVDRMRGAGLEPGEQAWKTPRT